MQAKVTKSARHHADVKAKSGNVLNILDVGTGFGNWAKEMAQWYSRATVIGWEIGPRHLINDILRPQRNLKFLVGDYHEEWPFKDSYFDLVHIGRLTDDFDHLICQAYRCLRPNGRLESVEVSFALNSEKESGREVVSQVEECLEECLEELAETPLSATPEELMQKVGFQDVKCQEYKIPLGEWEKGNKRLCFFGLQAFDAYFSSLLEQKGWYECLSNATVLCARMRQEVQDTCDKHQLSYTIKVISGVKSGVSEESISEAAPLDLTTCKRPHRDVAGDSDDDEDKIFSSSKRPKDDLDIAPV
ncbi:S-adenosyl-L-methionine-dependent methyltransferase [Trichoderma velutinum]